MPLVHSPLEKNLQLPQFQLPIVTGGVWSARDLPSREVSVFMFICNHCPYVKAIEDRLIRLGQELRDQGVPLIGICSNDAQAYPEDSLEKLRERALEKNYSFPYLYDETQEVARQFGAVCTPDFFVFNRQGQLAYRGRLDDSWKDASQVTRQELLQAVKDLRTQGHVGFQEVPSMGCSMKWKASP